MLQSYAKARNNIEEENPSMDPTTNVLKIALKNLKDRMKKTLAKNMDT